MSRTRILCSVCGFPMVFCACPEGSAFGGESPQKIETPKCPKCQGVPVQSEIEGCYGCLDCDFTGTLEGYEQMQRMVAEGHEAQDAYIRAGVCSGCGARSAAEAEKMCKPQSIGETGDFGCAGEDLWQEQREEKWQREDRGGLRERTARGSRPKIVCICGSSRFADVAAVKQWEYAKKGVLALGMHLLPSWYQWKAAEGKAPHPEGGHGAELEGVASVLDELHLRKIDMADEVLVVNVGGYIGDRTRFEIDYAEKLGKPVTYLEKTEAPL